MWALSRRVDDPGAAVAQQAAATSDDIASLLVRAGEGDGHAWRLLLDRYARRVYALARSRLRDPDTAEEITQSVFVTIAENLSAGGYTERGRFESWLFRVAANRVRDEARRRKRHAVPTDPGAMPDPPMRDAPAPDPDRFTPLRDAVAQLSDADRTVIELRHHAGLGFKEIAECLGEPLGTLLARHHRALKKLRTILESAAVEGDTP
jgi:RNA polymerase sigma-70 factor (ECF subfamily)